MLVALTMRIVEAESYIERRDCISHDWIVFLAALGHTPLPVPNRGDPAALLDRARPDVLVLTGGDDIGATPERDAAERALLRVACDRGLPVLGVCRGLQMINDHFGGTMAPVAGHVAAPHRVAVEPGWRELYGAATEVNSFHALGIAAAGLADGLVATARDGDGFVEAAVHRDLPVAGVMWHPERAAAPPGDPALLDALVARRSIAP